MDSAEGMLVPDTSPETVYRAVYEAHPVTLLPQWAGWLVKSLRSLGWLTDLDCAGMKAGLVKATTEGLDRLVSDGVKSGAIRIAERAGTAPPRQAA
jgi:hypothetical protein